MLDFAAYYVKRRDAERAVGHSNALLHHNTSIYDETSNQPI